MEKQFKLNMTTNLKRVLVTPCKTGGQRRSLKRNHNIQII